MKKILLASMFCSAAAFAGAPETKHDFAPPTELAKLNGMLGTWKCDGTAADFGKTTSHATRSTMKLSSELGGHWIHVSYDETKTKENPQPFAFREIIGYDKGTGRYERLFVDNFGGKAMFTAGPAGADGKVEWTGDATFAGLKMPMKDIITPKSEKEYTVDVQVQGPDGAWKPVANMTCKK